MRPERGAVYAARFPHAAGTRGKKRPVVVVQADLYNGRLLHAVVVQITTNLADRDDPACVLIEASAPEGKAAGLTQDSQVSGYLISLMTNERLQDRIGTMDPVVMQRIDQCLKFALGLS